MSVTHLYLATRNAHKAGEITAILGSRFQCHTLNELPGVPAVIEDAPDFAGNALKKAAALADWLRQHPSLTSSNGDSRAFILADDSGLEVDALGGAPGVHSARFAALDVSVPLPDTNSTDCANNAKLLRLLANVPAAQRTARFRCVLALMQLNPKPESQNPELFTGTCEGRIAFSPSGSGGFGYDPLFLPLGQECSFAALGDDAKNALSHRACALGALRAWFDRQ